MNGYELTRNFYMRRQSLHDISHVHADMFFCLLEMWNRFGQPASFSVSRDLVMHYCKISRRNTYYDTLNKLIEHNFIIMVKKGNNQFNESAIIGISYTDTPIDTLPDIPLDTPPILNRSSIRNSTDTLYEYKNNMNIGTGENEETTPEVKTETLNTNPKEERKVPPKERRKEFVPPTIDELHDRFAKQQKEGWGEQKIRYEAEEFMDYYIKTGWRWGKNNTKPVLDLDAHIRTWIRNSKKYANQYQMTSTSTELPLQLTKPTPRNN